MQNFSQNSAGYLVNHLARLLAAQLQDRLKPLGLSTGVFPVMVQLWQRDGQTQKELVDRIGVEQATMANTLNRMERDGLITRQKDDADGRIRIVRLTPKGADLRDPALEAAQAVNADLMEGYSMQEQEVFLGQLRQLIGHLEDSGPRRTLS